MSFKSLFQKEDYCAIWIGVILLSTALLLFSLNKPKDWDKLKDLDEQISTENNTNFKTTFWYQLIDEQKSIAGSKTKIGKQLKQLTAKPSKWKTNPLDAFYVSASKAQEISDASKEKLLAATNKTTVAYELAREKEQKANAALYQDAMLNQEATTAIASWRSATKELQAVEKKIKTKASNHFPSLLLLFFMLLLLFGLGKQAMGTPILKFALSFAAIFGLAIVAYLLGGQQTIKAYGLGYAFWAILIGLLISNTLGTPAWLKPALSTEFYIKTALVLLGAEVLIGKVAAIGLPGVFVAWVVTPIVLLSTFWFGQKVLKIGSKTLNMTISADMSVCGVSAAVATAAACKAKKEELTLAIGLSMIFTSIMMIVMPMFIKAVGMPEVLGGAWIGGTVDATGAVVAAGAFLGNRALNVAATIKMIQNILIGIISFGVALYFSKKEDDTTNANWKEIFKHFPKFILGFITVSIVFSILYEILGDAKGYALIDQGVIGNFSKNIRGWCFCLAFVSIGLSINFKSLKEYLKEGKPLLLYLCGQAFNLALTLLMAYIMFYLVFPEITEKI